jgi:hypothetical protein
MTPWENVEYLKAIRDRAAQGAKAAAEAMARYTAERAAADTLQRATHGVGEYYKAAPGAPPASASGGLAAAMYSTRAQGGLKATAQAGNRDDRAALFEYGCEPVTPSHMKVMHWVDSGGSWYHARLPADGSDFPAHPFLQPTVDEAISGGGLREAAIEAFAVYDP